MLPTTTQYKIMILVLLIVLVSSPIVLSWHFYKQHSIESYLHGMQVPSIVVSTMNGTTFSLTYRGKKYVLVFFAAECSSCRGELSNLELLYKQFKPQIDIFAISLSKLEKTKTLISSKNYSFPVFQWKGMALKDSMKIVDVPTTLFVDEQRIIRHGYVGDRTIKDDKRLIQDFIEESFQQKQ
jgi:peroxiredoxin